MYDDRLPYGPDNYDEDVHEKCSYCGDIRRKGYLVIHALKSKDPRHEPFWLERGYRIAGPRKVKVRRNAK